MNSCKYIPMSAEGGKIRSVAQLQSFSWRLPRIQLCPQVILQLLSPCSVGSDTETSFMFSRYQQHAASRPGLTAFIALLFTSVIAYVGTTARHSLLTSALAWLAICAYTSFTLGRKGLIGAGLPQKLAWAAGGLLALGQVQEKAVNGSGVWWAKVILSHTSKEEL